MAEGQKSVPEIQSEIASMAAKAMFRGIPGQAAKLSELAALTGRLSKKKVEKAEAYMSTAEYVQRGASHGDRQLESYRE